MFFVAPLHPSPPSIFYSNTLSTSITLLWTQPDGDIVDNYTIFTSYFIRQCNGSFDLGKKIVIDGIDGTLKMYTLTNLEADTDYNITIVAHNEAGSSKESMTKITKTNVEGKGKMSS